MASQMLQFFVSAASRMEKLFCSFSLMESLCIRLHLESRSLAGKLIS